MTIEYHWTAFGGVASVAALEAVVRDAAAVEGFVGVVRQYAEHGAWAFSDTQGGHLERVVLASARTDAARFRAYSVFIRMDAGPASVRWWLSPRSGVSVGGEVRWAEHAVVSHHGDADRRDALDDLAARGRLYAEQWIEARLETTPSVGEFELRIEPSPAPRPFRRQARRLEDLARRARGASDVTWSAQADGRIAIRIRQQDGSVVQSALSKDDAEKLRYALTSDELVDRDLDIALGGRVTDADASPIRGDAELAEHIESVTRASVVNAATVCGRCGRRTQSVVVPALGHRLCVPCTRAHFRGSR